jgi:hypothetical protein
MIKTTEFERKLQQKIYQYTFDKNNPPVLLGSFKYTNYISDIDFSLFVRFNPTFIKILINKLQNLKDFKFLYLNAGIDQRFKLPWLINYEPGSPFGLESETCNFNLHKTNEWFESLVQKNILRPDNYEQIYNILNKGSLILGDLIDIQDIIYEYSSIKWFLPDIIKGSKNVGGVTYLLLDELKKEEGPVLNSIYIDGNNVVSVDIGLVDKKYKKPIWSRMYKYYTKNWYKILKSYKKLISKDFEQEYRNVIKTMELDNSILAQLNLFESIQKYNAFPINSSIINILYNSIKQNLLSIGINMSNLKDDKTKLVDRLNTKAEPHIDYFLDKLTNTSRITTYMKLRLIELSQIKTNINVLIDRASKGVKCPFFKDETDEVIDMMASKLMIEKDLVLSCFLEISKKYKRTIKEVIYDNFRESPINRLFLIIKNELLYIRGSFLTEDHNFLEKIGEKKHEYYIIDKKYIKRLQAYLLTGK